MKGSQTIWQISVGRRAVAYDAAGRGALAAARHAGYAALETIRVEQIYLLEGNVNERQVEMLCESLLADPVTDQYTFRRGTGWPEQAGWPERAGSPNQTDLSDQSDSSKKNGCVIDVHLLAGVTDTAADSVLSAANELLAHAQDAAATASDRGRLGQVRTARRYWISGMSDPNDLERFAGDVLANACIERAYIRCGDRSDALPDRFPIPPALPFELRTVAIRDAEDLDLAKVAKDWRLLLSVEEMRTIREHFRGLSRDPTDLELETIAQTWSEHCVHKTIKSAVEYEGLAFGADGDDGKTIRSSYKSLLGETIVAATDTLDRDWCWSVFADNAGVIAFDEIDGIAVKVETHNHPSAIEPYGGAATGAGGCIRDILGTGLGAKPIANTDVFCVASPEFDPERIPDGVLRPARVLGGVVAGVRDYGNRMGIPTVAGAIHFDDRYLANPLVFCGCVGLIPKSKVNKKPQAGDAIVVIGGRTGRDGIGGATFSSGELTDQHADEFAHAVQIGNPIVEKKVADALLRARDDDGGCLYSAVTDCGAGGLSSAVGEMAEGLGASVDLEQVPLKYSGLRYNEIWLSEAQERMVLAVSPDNIDRLKAICREEEIEATVIGLFTDDGELVIRHDGREVGRLSLAFMHDGRPRVVRQARWPKYPDAASRQKSPAVQPGDGEPLNQQLISTLSSLNVCSRRAVFSQYDHEVQGRIVTRAYVGPGEGPSDAAVLRPKLDGRRAIAIGMGLCPQVSDDDPYWMAVLAIDEALRNVISSGADPKRVAILDNFCWPSCDSPEALGSLVRACQGCHDAAVAYGLPFISGKDSLHNQFSLSFEQADAMGWPTTIQIPATLLVTAVGLIDDVSRCVTTDLKSAGNRLMMARIDVRQAGLDRAVRFHHRVAALLNRGLVAACHDVSDGGLGACIAEMCIGSTLGADISLDRHVDPSTSRVLFDERYSGYLLEIKADAAPSQIDAPAESGDGEWIELGAVVAEPRLVVRQNGQALIDEPVAQLAGAWRGGLELS